MSKVAVAVIGAGAIGRAHIGTITGSAQASLAGIAEPAEAGRELAAQLGVPWFPDHEALLDTVKPEAAIVATPNATHRSVAEACITRGVAPLIEKPIASTLEDALVIADASQKAGVPVLVGHHRRHNPIVRAARGAIAAGRLGRLLTASVLYTFYKPPEYFELDWRRKPGGGPVLINLIHEIDLIRHLCGEIACVQALASNAVRGFEVEDTAAVLLGLTNGCMVTVALTDSAVTPWSWDLAARENPAYPPQPTQVQTHFLTGTEGALTLPTLEHWSYRGRKGWFEPISRDPLEREAGEPYSAQLAHFCRVARREERPLIDAADGALTLRATNAVHEAARSGQMVTLEREP